jgi:hypothetical protein
LASVQAEVTSSFFDTTAATPTSSHTRDNDDELYYLAYNQDWRDLVVVTKSGSFRRTTATSPYGTAGNWHRHRVTRYTLTLEKERDRVCLRERELRIDF